jgi:hypothetical protein
MGESELLMKTYAYDMEEFHVEREKGGNVWLYPTTAGLRMASVAGWSIFACL